MAVSVKRSAKSKILSSLYSKSLSVRQARARYRIYNVSARVAELRQDGYNIITRRRADGVRVYSF
jgi:hypothetical protein